MTDLLIHASCDTKYFERFAGPFVRSILQNTPYSVHIDLIKRIEESVDLNIVSADNIPRVKIDPKIIYEQRQTERVYPSVLRFHTLYKHLSATSKEGVMVLDIDSIVRKPFIIPEPDRLGLYLREPLKNGVPWEEEGTNVAAGQLYVPRNEKGLRFAIRTKEHLFKLPQVWFVDQVALWRAYKDFQEQFKEDAFDLSTLNQLDWDFKEDSPIWTGKGNRKNSETFTKEMKLYEKSSNILSKT